jgi:hypothetical protein
MSEDDKNEESKKTLWHRILASVLQKWLTPVGFTIKHDVALTTGIIRADILIIKHDDELTPEQHYRLADGIRNSKVKHCLAEFKYTESFNNHAIIQLLSYGDYYHHKQSLNESDVDLFLLLSHTPQQETLTQMGYTETEEQGIYTSQDGLYSKVTILSLNDLADTPNNIPLKCFAGKKVEQIKAFEAVGDKCLRGMSFELEHVLVGLRELLIKKGLDMNTAEIEELTPEYVEQLGKKMIETFAEERLRNLSVDERLKDVSAEELTKRLNPKERLKGLSSDDVINGLSEDVLQKLKDKLNKK